MTAGPLETHIDIVRPEWVDPNGHMNIGYYAVAFDRATDGFFDHLGVGFADLERTGHTMFLVEMHMTVGRELLAGAKLRFTTQMLGFDDKRVLYFHCLFHAAEGYRAATCEIMGLHVAMATRKTVPLTPETRARVEELWRTHRHLPRPVEAGRATGLSAGRPG